MLYDETSVCQDCGITYLTTQGHNCPTSPAPLELWCCPADPPHSKYVPTPEGPNALAERLGWHRSGEVPFCPFCLKPMVLRTFPAEESAALLATVAPVPPWHAWTPQQPGEWPREPWHRRLLGWRPWRRSPGSTAPAGKG